MVVAVRPSAVHSQISAVEKHAEHAALHLIHAADGLAKHAERDAAGAHDEDHPIQDGGHVQGVGYIDRRAIEDHKVKRRLGSLENGFETLRRQQILEVLALTSAADHDREVLDVDGLRDALQRLAVFERRR